MGERRREFDIYFFQSKSATGYQASNLKIRFPDHQDTNTNVKFTTQQSQQYSRLSWALLKKLCLNPFRVRTLIGSRIDEHTRCRTLELRLREYVSWVVCGHGVCRSAWHHWHRLKEYTAVPTRASAVIWEWVRSITQFTPGAKVEGSAFQRRGHPHGSIEKSLRVSLAPSDVLIAGSHHHLTV